MPELPEVETVRRGLAPHIEGRQIIDVRVLRPDLRFALPHDFARRLTGARLTQLTRRAKYLLAYMHDNKRGDKSQFIWLSHLGMTGRFIYSPPNHETLDEAASQKHVPHTHVMMDFEHGGSLAYCDTRRFGFMDLIDGPPEKSRFLAALGPEPLSNDFCEAHLAAICAGRQTPVKNILLNQHVVAGLGNIYVCEALFLARISPRRKAANLGSKRIARLVPAIRHVLQAAIQAGGSTLRDFAASDGQAGYFQHEFSVYGRANAPCSRRACDGIVARIVQSGRASFFCPRCQK